MSRPLPLDEALAMVAAERRRQDAKWGANRDLTGLERLAILAEEFGEIAALVTRAEVPPEDESNAAFLEPELIQVAAVAVAWVQAIEGGAPQESDLIAELVEALEQIASPHALLSAAHMAEIARAALAKVKGGTE